MTTLAMLAALGTAACWSAAPFIAFAASKSHGAFAFMRMRTLCAAAILLLLLPLHAPISAWRSVMPIEHMLLFAATGIIGIVAGDALYFAALRRVGPRRNAMLFTANAPLAFLYAAILIGEFPSALGAAGCIVTLGGVILAIRYGGEKGSFRNEANRFEATEGALPAAAAFGLGAAALHSLALVMVHGMARAGFDPLFAAAIRVLTAALILAPLPLLPLAALQAQRRISREFTIRAAAVGIIAMVLGISLLTFALAQNVPAGIIVSLSATAPVMVLFIQWALTKKRPRTAAFTG
ncbi:MAG: DMT family transporter, partial [Gammaproteobacteria bacterium]